jgi:hypothetical protein
MLTVLADRFAIKLERWTSDVAAFELRRPHAAAHSFDDLAAFQLGDRADDHDDALAVPACIETQDDLGRPALLCLSLPGISSRTKTGSPICRR